MFHSKINKKRQAQMISLYQSIKDFPDIDKEQKQHSLKMLIAQELFEDKKYARALNIFLELNTDLTEVVKLLPELDNKPGKHGKIKGEDLDNALKALVEYLLALRSRKSVSAGSGSQDDVKKLLELIDITLLKCYLQLNDHAKLTQVLRLNNCQLEEAEIILLTHEKYKELVTLYQTKGQYRKALQLMKEHAKHKDLKGFSMPIEFLQQLGAEHLDLIFEYSDWILQNQHEEGLKIFTANKTEVKNLPREKVLEFLSRKYKSLVTPYLEHIIHKWNDVNSLFHDVLINVYREEIMEKKSKCSEEEIGNTKSKLLEFLEKSSHYTPESVIKKFPTDSLFEERAVILERLGRHEQAFAIYIHILGDINKAIQYCEKNYDSTNEESRDIYIVLLQYLINPQQCFPVGPLAKIPRHPKTCEPDLETALSILDEHGDKISPIKALSVLPDSVPLARLKNYLQSALDQQLTLKRRTQVSVRLLYMEHLQVEEMKHYLESKNIVVNEHNACRVCKKRFRNQNALMRYPNGAVVHYSCRLDK